MVGIGAGHSGWIARDSCVEQAGAEKNQPLRQPHGGHAAREYLRRPVTGAIRAPRRGRESRILRGAVLRLPGMTIHPRNPFPDYAGGNCLRGAGVRGPEDAH